MKPEAAIYIIRQALEVGFIIAGPPLMTGLVVGLIISIFQAATQIQEMTLSFIPKLIAVFGVQELSVLEPVTGLAEGFQRCPQHLSVTS